jgi:hypothetical protein
VTVWVVTLGRLVWRQFSPDRQLRNLCKSQLQL